MLIRRIRLIVATLLAGCLFAGSAFAAEDLGIFETIFASSASFSETAAALEAEIAATA